MGLLISITPGKIFNNLTVLGREGSVYGKATWKCMCKCGKPVVALGTRLISGRTNSCGCAIKKGRAVTHGQSGANLTPEYTSWAGMKERCSSPLHKSYHNYGGRGITVCEAWDDFTVFFKDMGERPEGMTLDRKDNNRGYSKDNCRWATRKEQCRNQRRNIVVEYLGEKITLTEFSQRTGVVFKTAKDRLKRGWSPEKIASTPPRSRNQWVIIYPESSP